MNYDEIKESIRKHEGYRLEPYKCTEGFLTGGIGHKINEGEEIPTTEEGWLELFDKDFEIALNGARRLLNEEETHPEAFGIVIEMCFQLGEFGVAAVIYKNAYISIHINSNAGHFISCLSYKRQTK